MLLSYNSDTTQLPLGKYTILWVSVCSRKCAAPPLSDLRAFSGTPPLHIPCSLALTPASPLPAPVTTDARSVSIDLPSPDTSHKCSHTGRVGHIWPSSPSTVSSRVMHVGHVSLPHRVLWGTSVGCTDTLHFVSPSFRRGTSVWFPPFGSCKECCCVLPSGGPVFSWLLGTSIGVELRGHRAALGRGWSLSERLHHPGSGDHTPQ